jgi:hypothetical protein
MARERIAELEVELARAKAELRKPVKKQAPPGEQAAARAWARQKGIPVNDIGRVPAAVLQQWREAAAS